MWVALVVLLDLLPLFCGAIFSQENIKNLISFSFTLLSFHHYDTGCLMNYFTSKHQLLFMNISKGTYYKEAHCELIFAHTCQKMKEKALNLKRPRSGSDSFNTIFMLYRSLTKAFNCIFTPGHLAVLQLNLPKQILEIKSDYLLSTPEECRIKWKVFFQLAKYRIYMVPELFAMTQ